MGFRQGEHGCMGCTDTTFTQSTVHSSVYGDVGTLAVKRMATKWERVFQPRGIIMRCLATNN